MKYTIIILALLLSGCVTPVKRSFPDIPNSLQKPCENLTETPQTTKLSEVLEIVVENYTKYKECQIKTETWIEWYNQQRKIFDSVK